MYDDSMMEFEDEHTFATPKDRDEDNGEEREEDNEEEREEEENTFAFDDDEM